ncbi:hypothetical protein EJ03DRAFT_143584 [Teratosphaeria nubilosa]|uniref:Uncharacterized protein n=1 Tax=Teratosphaeria nubilosa TaxID=161662 RepID=A0A6G1L473_9PEZI|nr:hypothetical protein EJ03DRAFT_143584 [Teratosphaeria nubilosa]
MLAISRCKQMSVRSLTLSSACSLASASTSSLKYIPCLLPCSCALASPLKTRKCIQSPQKPLRLLGALEHRGPCELRPWGRMPQCAKGTDILGDFILHQQR